MKLVSFPSSRTAAGFTLLELLAAVAILAIISTMLFSAFNEASKAWLLAEKRVEISEQGRAALDLFARELAQAITTNRGQRIFVRGGRDWISFLAPPVDTRTNQPIHGISSLPDCVITYQLQTGTNSLYRLCRTAKPITDAAYSGGQPPRLSAMPDLDTLVDNVVSLAFSNTMNGTSWAPGAAPANNNPLAVSLTLTVVDSRTAGRLDRATGSGRDEMLRAASQTFTVKAFLPTR